ncbi:MAG: hypothetical protein NXH87_07695 [Rhodobiaceae bacterium]|nr:hypothetical protein [Rhodobiaceae bacterium]
MSLYKFIKCHGKPLAFYKPRPLAHMVDKLVAEPLVIEIAA